MHAAGAGASTIARATGIPRSTVKGWLAQPAYRPGARVRDVAREPERAVLQPAAYAYLLGLYLGDGHVAQTAGRFRLEIKLDALYPGIVSLAVDAVRAAARSRRRRSAAPGAALCLGVGRLVVVARAAAAARPGPQAPVGPKR